MAEQKNIETGVDKLVDLISRKNRIAINDAAKELGVSVDIVQEWANFLEEEGIITIENKLNRTYLCERKLNKVEVEKKAKEYSSKKDAFTRKVENALSSLQKESEGLDEIKAQFEKLKDAIGSDINAVRGELSELKHYEELKKNIDKEMLQQKIAYHEMVDDLHKKVNDERKRYEDFFIEISKERSKIDEAKVELSFLEKKEETLGKRLDALKEIMKSVESDIAKQTRIMKDSAAKIASNVKEAEEFKKDMKKRIDKNMEPVLKLAKDNEEKILSVQDAILRKVMAKKTEIDKYKFQSLQAAEKFKTFFDKKAKTENLINELGKEKKEIEESMKNLVAKARSFNLAVKSTDVRKYVKELEEDFKKMEKHKSGFLEKLSGLTDLINKKE